MPTTIRKTKTPLSEAKRETNNSLIWQVRSNAWRPPTDVYETDAGLVVRVDIAGIQDDNCEVAIQGNCLFINGLRSDISERRAYYQMEIPFGKFSVGIELPAEISVKKTTIKYEDGFMTINLPKKKLVE